MKRRLLILTAGFGEGHNAAARALALACDAAYGAGTACVADGFALAAPRTNSLVRRGYLALINASPSLWGMAYRRLDASTLFPRWLRAMRRERRVLSDLIARERPAAICCTFPAYAFMLAERERRGGSVVPYFNVVTDSISINSLWWRAGAAGWFLPNEDSAGVLRRAGIASERLHPLGFPVPPFFGEHARDLSPPHFALGRTPRVLHIINSGTRGAAEIARELLRATEWEVTCTVGRDESLRRELATLASRRRAPATILGWTDQIPRLLMTHHAVISKAGGATTQEAIAARCPMIVSQIVPGQEEGNYELLRRHGIGARAETPEAVTRELRRAFQEGGRVWSEWRAALTAISRPHAAREIVRHVFAHPEIEAQREPVPIPLRAALESA